MAMEINSFCCHLARRTSRTFHWYNQRDNDDPRVLTLKKCDEPLTPRACHFLDRP